MVSEQTKTNVQLRQNGRSLLSEHPITKDMCIVKVFNDSKYVDFEWNVVGLTTSEKEELESGQNITVNGRKRYTNQEARTIIKNHLKIKFNKWSEEICKLKKGCEEADYGVQLRKSL